MHNKLITVLIGLMLVLGGGVVVGEKEQESCYAINSGRNNPMCRLFLQNLNRFCKESLMVCEPRIHPDLAKYFSVPKWETVDYTSHLDIVAQYIRTRAIIPINCTGQCVADTQEKKWQEYKPELLKRLNDSRIKLVRSRIHITYDDKPRLAYRLIDTICSPDDMETYGISRKPGLMIVDEETGKPNAYYSKINRYGCYDVLLYQGGAYLIDLDDLPYSPEVYNNTYIECHFEYTKKGDKK